MFQFLIGTLKTLFFQTPAQKEQEYVSIPHRHSKNNNVRQLFYKLILFQFLIGTLKTNKENAEILTEIASFNSS